MHKGLGANYIARDIAFPHSSVNTHMGKTSIMAEICRETSI